SGPESLTPIDQQPMKKEAEIYRLEAFASTDPALAENAVVFVRCSLAAGTQGLVTAQIGPPAGSEFSGGAIHDSSGNAVVMLDNAWKWERQGGHATLTPDKSATLAIATKPLPRGALTFDSTT